MPKTGPFERYADEYDGWFDRNPDIYEAELRAIGELLPSPGAQGVEVGVGTGRFAVPLGIRTGVEPSERMARRARELGVDVHRGTAERLPFEDGSFDFVLMVATICFVDDVAASFSEARRVLRDGGAIVVGFIDRESGLGRRYEEGRAASRFYRDAVFFSSGEVIGALEEAGFEVAAVRQALIGGEEPGTVLEGSGRGAFVVVRGEKRGKG
ncbi:MAG: methyltransferase domain-containing protein [Candidatus Krumholzibacteria bacterium]|nr:methyltransferase domain-containing protein [Candidatus Krumholzibacteria bacterium]